MLRTKPNNALHPQTGAKHSPRQDFSQYPISTHPNLPSKGKERSAFTLAEVLITLGIIGVVAAMTIPTLVQNYNTRAWNTAATVFDRKLEEALKTMNTQSTLAGHTTTESFVQELSKHFKTNKICSNDKLLDCFSGTVYWGGGDATPEEVDMSIIKTALNFGQKDWNTNVVGVQFANGTSAMIAYNPTNTCTQDPYSNQVTGGDCLAILYDTSGEKNPNTSGKDLRSNGNVTKLGKGCAFEIGSTCYTTTPFKPEPHTWNACTEEGTTSDPEDLAIMATYGMNYCRPRFQDYWAGAVIACGGVDKLPSLEQLAKLGNYLYNTDIIAADSFIISGITLDTTKVISLGFSLSVNNQFRVWANEEEGENGVFSYTREYLPGLTNKIGYPRSQDNIQAVCIE